MPTPESLARSFQRQIEQGSIDAVRAMTEALARALPGLVSQATEAAARVAALRTEGRSAEASVYAAQRSRAIALQVQAEVERLVQIIKPSMLNGQQQAVSAGLTAAEQLVSASLPEGLTLDVLARFGRPWQPAPLQAVHALVGATGPGSPLDRLMGQVAADAGRRVRETLTSGLLAGKNPRVTARALRREVGLPAKRAETISIDQTLKAYRSASRYAYSQNPDVVKSYIRRCAKRRRTCIACLVADGTEYELESEFDEHVRGACTVIPKTITFRDLGLNIDEAPRPQPESGRAWFARQPVGVQREILGPGGLAAYQRGVPLERFVKRVESETWGPSLQVRPLREIA